MLTVVIRSVTNPDFYIPLRRGILIEAKRLLMKQSILSISECADYQHVTFECTEMHASGHTAAVIMKNYATRVRFVITLTFPVTLVEIGDDRYTIEFADLMPHGKETP